MVVSIVMGVPKFAGWFISWKSPIYKCMMTRGTPMTLETSKAQRRSPGASSFFAQRHRSSWQSCGISSTFLITKKRVRKDIKNSPVYKSLEIQSSPLRGKKLFRIFLGIRWFQTITNQLTQDSFNPWLNRIGSSRRVPNALNEKAGTVPNTLAPWRPRKGTQARSCWGGWILQLFLWHFTNDSWGKARENPPLNTSIFFGANILLMYCWYTLPSHPVFGI